jgi:hypothetical protein
VGYWGHQYSVQGWEELINSSGTCISKWRHVGSDVESLWATGRGKKVLEEVFLKESPCTLL